MPTLLSVAGYRVFIVMQDCAERRHVHVSGGASRAAAKFWLEPAVELVTPGRYHRADVTRIQRLVRANRDQLIQRWDEECATAEARDR
jgi:hypothetical protein